MSTSALELDDRAGNAAVNLCSTPTVQGPFRASGFDLAAVQGSDMPATTGAMLTGGGL